MEGRYHVALVTSAQPSANPRLVKEAKSLLQAGYFVSVIWCPISPWADNFDKNIFKDYQEINWVQAGYHSTSQPLGYFYARIRQKVWQVIYKIIGNYFDAAIKSLVLYSQELTSLALQQKADIYIGHNLGALPPISKASKRHKAKSIFDFEDYHRGESHENSLQTKRVIDVENKYIPLISSVTTASPSISNTYKKIFPDKLIITINNCFPLEYAIDSVKEIPQIPLKLFWFSQYVGLERGLQTVFHAMSNFSSDQITLTLLGKATDDVKEYFYALRDKVGLKKLQVNFLKPVPETEILKIAAMHHIGLASEPGRDQNNNLALSNKIMLYILAGNALVMSDTIAQKEFYKNYPSIGLLYVKEDIVDLTKAFLFYIENPSALNEHRSNSLDLSKKKLNWNQEQNVFLDNVNRSFA